MNRLLLAALFITMANPAFAATDDDVMTCAGIVNDSKERLACFDAVAKLVLSRKISAPEEYILQRFKRPKEDPPAK